MNNLNILVIGDPHFMDSSINETNELTFKLYEFIGKCNTKNYKLHELINMYKSNITDTTLEFNNLFNGIDFAVILGDILDRHEKATVYPHYYSIQLFKKIKSLVPLFVLIGNHDRPNNSDFLSDYHFFSGLDECKNLYIIDKVKIYSINKINDILIINDVEKDNNDDNNKFMFVPYVPNGKFKDAINTKINYIKNIKDINCIFAHQEFYGAKYNGITSENGDKLNEEYPLVVSGHIHEKGYVNNKNVIYVGSSRQIAKNENPNKHIMLLNFEGNNYKHYMVDLNLIKKLIIKIKADEINNVIIDNNNITYIMVSGTTYDIKALKKSIIFKSLEKNKNVKFSYDIKDNDESILLSNQTINPDENKRNTEPYILKLKNKIVGNSELNEMFHRLFKV